MNQKQIEDKWQKVWEQKKVFEPKVNKNKKKFFGNEAYPYANSVLHIGHGRTYTLADIYLRYKRVCGYNVLQPLGFHISGTPVLAVSDGIKRSDPKIIKQVRDAVSDYITNEKEQNDLIETFKKPQNIADFFSDKIIGALNSIGASTDWSRRFTTGEPTYNKFIEWQYSKLKKAGLLKQGKYPILYSAQDENAVGEDDIADGDTNKVGISEMTLIKAKINNFKPLPFFDKNGKKLGTDYMQHILFDENKYLQNTCCFVIDKNNNLLLQKSSNKVFSKNKIQSTAGGSLEEGATKNSNMVKELLEEVNLKLDENDLKDPITWTFEKDGKYHSCIRNQYFIKVDFDLSKHNVKNSEVDNVIYISISEFENLLKNEPQRLNKFNVLKQKEIIENLNNLKNEKGIKCEISNERKSDNLDDEYICCSTLRPDAIFGTTNLYIKPDMKLVKLNVNGEVWIVSKKAQVKIENQFDNVFLIDEILGKSLLDKVVITPITNRVVPIYEADFCDENHGTGIVYSSPADSPHDYINLFERLYPNKSLNEFLDKEPLNLKSITKTYDKKGGVIKYLFDIPAYSKLIEKKIFNTLGNEKKLEEAKQELYKEAHFGSIMINCGEEFDGTKLKNNEAFNKTQKKLKELGLAEKFYETTRRAKTRGGDDVIVANLNGQWFLDYSDEKVKQKARELLEYCDFYPKNLIDTQLGYINWANLRPCARKRGLGTKLPYDKNWIIEPLSDSTIYQMLYLVIKKIREYNIAVEDLTEEFFDEIFLK